MLVDKDKGQPKLLGNEVFKDTNDDAEFSVEHTLKEITAGVQGALVGGAVTTVRSHSLYFKTSFHAKRIDHGPCGVSLPDLWDIFLSSST
jgi:hypothetical protein